MDYNHSKVPIMVFFLQDKIWVVLRLLKWIFILIEIFIGNGSAKVEDMDIIKYFKVLFACI